MRNAITLSLGLVVILLTGCHADPATDVTSVKPTTCGDVRNMHRIGDLYLSGAPTPNDYPLLKDLGIKTVLNIRHDKETPGLDDAKLVEAQGMTYIHLPWNGADQLTDEKLDAMRQVLRDAERPMLFHCGSANRVGAGWLVYRVLDENVGLEAALAEAKAVGLRTSAYQAKAVAYIEANQ